MDCFPFQQASCRTVTLCMTNTGRDQWKSPDIHSNQSFGGRETWLKPKIKAY